MDLLQYQRHATRTMNPDLGGTTQLANVSLGIVGELGEVIEKILFQAGTDEENVEFVKDEGGDLMWYIANICSILSVDWTLIMPRELEKIYTDDDVLLLHAVKYASNLADITKKTIAQGHTFDIEKALIALTGLLDSLFRFFDYYGLTPEEVCEYNHLKLRRRYPNGFSVDRSVNREV